MNLEGKIKQEILSHYKSVRSFAIQIGIPYTTISSMLRKGVSGTAVQTVIIVCDALGMSIDDLANEMLGRNTKTNKDRGKDKLLQNYQNLNEEGCEKLIEYSQDLVDTERYKKPNTFGLDSETSEELT